MYRNALLAGVLAPLLLWMILPVGTLADSRLSTLQNKIGKTQRKIGAKKGHERVLTTQISAYNRRIEQLAGRITAISGRVVRLQSELDGKRAELLRLQGELRRERARVVRLRTRLASSRRTLARRLVALYESDPPDLITVVLQSKGFADLIEREEIIRRISAQDHRIITTVAAAKVDAKAAAVRLAGLETRQRRATAIVLQRRNQIAGARTQLVSTRAGVQRVRATKAAALASTRDARHALEGRLTDLKAEEAKIQNALNAASGALPAGPIRGNGRLIWPVNGPITSPFCESRAWESCHPGIDIGVPSGTPVRAAAGGRVALEQSEAASGGYGNFLCIQHTASMSTCYAHLDHFTVGMGARVSQGQVVAISDCTGRCYGAHLHFEVRINGAVTNPLNYL